MAEEREVERKQRAKRKVAKKRLARAGNATSTRTSTQRQGAAATARALESRLDEPHGKLWRFLNDRMPEDEIGTWARLVAERHTIEIRASVLDKPMRMGRHVVQELAAADAQRYVDALERRDAAGLPLIRP
jgi:hypothetical protein